VPVLTSKRCRGILHEQENQLEEKMMNQPEQVLNVLRAARNLVALGPCTGTASRDKYGMPCSAHSVNAHTFCTVAAVQKAMESFNLSVTLCNEVFEALRKFHNYDVTSDWHDDTPHHVVVETFNKAIARVSTCL